MVEARYDVVMALTYYAPYVSGLTAAAQMVAEGLAAEGRRVAVVATRHDPELPLRQRLRGVDVIRSPVVARVGKGTVSPAFTPTVARVARTADVVNLHLPLLEAGAVAMAVRNTPLVTTYQCDVSLPPSPVNRLQVLAVDASSRVAMRRSSTVAVSSDDYARSSRLWSSMAGRTQAIPPPCRRRDGGTPTFREGPGQHVGFLGRIVEEKGLEYLVDGFRARTDPDARLLIGGDFTNVAGGSVVARVRERIGDDPRVRLLGFLKEEQLPDFYASLDVFALPSINSLEAFGIVQVEAMMQGVPVVASDLPGVRVPVQRTGFGEVVPPRDAGAITRALDRLAADPPAGETGASAATAAYGEQTVVKEYSQLFDRVTAGAGRR